MCGTARFPSGLSELVAKLKAVNETLWDIEGGERDCERRHCFGGLFIRLARGVPFGNDKRAAIKKATPCPAATSSERSLSGLRLGAGAGRP